MSVAMGNGHSACGGSISQSRFVCQVVCTSIQGISAQLLGGPSNKVCLSTKCCVLAFKHLCCIWGVHWPKKVCLPSTSLANRWRIHQQKKVHLPSTSLASSGGSIGRRFVCQVLVLLVVGGSISRKIRLPNLSSLLNLLLLHRGLFVLHMKDQWVQATPTTLYVFFMFLPGESVDQIVDTEVEWSVKLTEISNFNPDNFIHI